MNYKGKEIVKDCLLQHKKGDWVRVLFVSEEHVHITYSRNTKEEAIKADWHSGSYTQSTIDKLITDMEYPLLGVYDKEGIEYRYGDEIMWGSEKVKVFQAIKTPDKNYDTILFKTNEFKCWDWGYSFVCTILNKPNTDEEEAIKLLTERGRIKDGKVIV